MPEFAVDRQTLSKFLRPEISKSAFHDLVAQGKIAPLDGLRGSYRLNESLIRHSLQPVPEWPEARNIGDREILELALTIAAPDVADPPPWLLGGALKLASSDAREIASRFGQLGGRRLAMAG